MTATGGGVAGNLPLVSNQYPGQPGDVPPTQVAPGGGYPPQQPGPPTGPPAGPPPGYPQQPPAPYGAPGGGGGYPPPPFGAPPTGGGGGGKKVLVIVAIVVAVVVLLIVGTAVALVALNGDDDDKPKPKVTKTITAPTTDVTAPTTPPTTDLTTPPTTDLTTPTTDTGGLPAEDPEITAQAYLNSLVEGNCLAVEGLSTPEWWQATFSTQRRCERQSEDSAEMTTAVYNSFEEPIDNGDGTITLVGDVTDSSDGTDYTVTWILAPSDDNATWLVDGFQLV